jgi:hypothetical protein
MPGAVTNPPFGVQDPANARALSAVSPNTRARGTNGLLATQADALVFPGPTPAALTGLWTMPSTRVSVGGVRVINAASQGTAFSVVGGATTTIGPLIVSISDKRVSIS